MTETWTRALWSRCPFAPIIGLTTPPQDTGHEMNTTTRQARLAELKRRVAKGEYTLDAGLLADEMLEKLRLVRTIRRQLVAGSEAERTRQARPRSRRRFEAMPQHHATRAPARLPA